MRAWVAAMGFEAGLGEVLCLPAPDGGVAAALAGWGTPQARARGRFHLAAAAGKLPSGRYALAEVPRRPRPGARGARLAARRLPLRAVPRGQARREPSSSAPDGVDAARVERIAAAARLVLDLINTPARDLGPEALEAAFVALARRHGAEVRVTRGAAALRAANLPMIEAVGAAAADPPRLLDLAWGRPDAPKVTLVGKGVCFDTGGLDIKPPASMGLMKKDMGGAATAMGLAEMIMGLGLDLRLQAAGAGGGERDLGRRRCGRATSCRAARG